VSIDEAALTRELMGTYRAEARERIDAITRLLLDLEKAHGPAAVAFVDQIFREVHSLKGAARSVSQSSVETSAHSFEGRIAVSRGLPEIDKEVMHAWYACLDELSALVELADARAGDVPDVGVSEPAAAGPQVTVPLDASIRVTIPRLDRLLADAGSLLVAEQAQVEAVSLLAETCRDIASLEASFRRIRSGEDPQAQVVAVRALRQRLQGLLQTLRRQRVEGRRQLQTLSDDLRTLRMMPIKSLFRSFDRMVHDLALETGKQVQIQIAGEEVELDKAVLDALRDPIVHLLRNAVDHGIETVAERRAAGKPETGTLNLSANRRGSEVLITLRDDGRGIDPAVIRAQAVKSQTLTPAAAEAKNDSEILELIFMSGFSTRTSADQISGRGLGLAIVRQALEALHGQITVENHAVGSGTTFEAAVPLTLATTRCLLMVAGGDTYAMPLESIRRTAIVAPTDFLVIEGRPAIRFEDRVAPFVHLTTLLHGDVVATSARLPTVILEAGAGRVAVAGDTLKGERELVVKRFPAVLPDLIPCLSGAAMLTSGEIVLVLDPADVVRIALAMPSNPAVVAPVTAVTAAPDKPRVLIADDSLTTRTLERNILKTAGYLVAEAPNGAEAKRMLQAEQYDVVVSDVDMPLLDGVGLTTWIRAQPNLATMPVILITAAEKPEDRLRGLNAGADAYIIKRQFRQSDLLETVDRLLGRARPRALVTSA